MKLSKLRAKTSMRTIGGEEVPRQGATSFGMRAGLKKGGSQYAGESGEIEGSPAKVRLDRARRSGGRACRAEGGEVDRSSPNPGEKSDAEQRKYLRKKAGDERMEAGANAGVGALTGAASLLPGSGKILRGFNIGMTGVNAKNAANRLANAKRADKEADEFEGRKRGGNVKKKGW